MPYIKSKIWVRKIEDGVGGRERYGSTTVTKQIKYNKLDITPSGRYANFTLQVLEYGLQRIIEIT